ncbi:MAG: heparinase II/III family protein [Pseudomonadota bacterium]
MQGGALAKPPFASPRPLPLGLSSAALAEDVFESLRRQADSLWSANLPSLRFPTLHAEGLTAQPRDMRPLRLESGRALMAGRFTLAGVQLAVGPKGDPWSAVFPSERFEQEMHRFAWLPELMSVGPAGAREALRHFLEWRRGFSRMRGPAWTPETLERRVFHLACAARRLAEPASDAERQIIVQTLALSANRLMQVPAGPGRRAERLAAVCTAGTALAGRAGDRLLMRGLPRLARQLDEAVLPDGGLKTRSPEQALELLFDLHTLDDGLSQRGVDPPEALSRAIDRLSGVARFFTLGDGRLASFHGGEAANAARIAAALAGEDLTVKPFGFAPYAGYHRLSGGAIEVMVDAAPPPTGSWSETACAQPLAIEVLCDGHRLISNCGWSPLAAHAAAALRLTSGGSTAGLAEASAGAPATGYFARTLGPRLIEGCQRVEARRNENEAGVWLELAHDGWLAEFGLVHERRLFLDLRHDELRGEDRFTPGPSGGRRRLTPFAVRFHLPPSVKVSLARDQKSVLLRGPTDRGWWLRNDAQEVLVETSVHFEEGQPRRCAQVVMKGQVDAERGAKLRWKLTPVDPGQEGQGRLRP